jgi:hypothetical protein
LHICSQTIHHFVVRVSRLQPGVVKEDQDEQDEVLLTSLALVSVAVMDVNDETPKFVAAPGGQIRVPEDGRPGQLVAAFVAEDADVEPANSLVVYSLEADDSDDALVDWTVDAEQVCGSLGKSLALSLSFYYYDLFYI